MKHRVPPDTLSIERPPSLAATVAERVRQAIVDLELPLGSEISEVRLAQRLGVSRTPVREALYLLQLQGLVTILPQKGSYVFFPTEEDLIDLCEYRIVIEQRAIRSCLERRKDPTLSALHESLGLMQTALRADDAIGYSRADTRLHEAFIENCGNRYIADGYSLVSGPIATLRTHLTVPLAGEQRRSFAEHREIVGLFAEGKPTLIDKLLRRHVLQTRASYLKALKAGFIGGVR